MQQQSGWRQRSCTTENLLADCLSLVALYDYEGRPSQILKLDTERGVNFFKR